ncbi:putative Ig domain-containing protein, partial [Puniceicoccaceae bacterium K14]|nr:putative Ig domain-containing protein [Puniceicoccaceae bacterium K14]
IGFKLPALSSGESVTGGSFSIEMTRAARDPSGGLDLYGLGYRSSSAVKVGDFYQGSFGGDSTDAWALEDDFVGSDASTGRVSSASSAEIGAYVAAQYAAGAGEGDYVFIRLSPSANESDYKFWEFDSANSGDEPVLELSIGDSNGGGEVPSNGAPYVASGLSARTAVEGSAFSYAIPGGAFADPDGDSLSYVASGVPSWLSFNGSTFTGTPSSAPSSHSITVRASDPSG